MNDTIVENQELSNRWLLAEQSYPELAQSADKKADQFIGRLALSAAIEIVNIDEQPSRATLLEATQLAALGDDTSKCLIKNNVESDVAERMFNAGHQTKVKLKLKNGQITQNERRLLDIHCNTIKYTRLNTEMLKRSRNELRNVIFSEELLSRNLLENHDAVIFSPASKDSKTRKDYGFYEDTETCSIQLISSNGDDLILETALVAGKKTPNSKRHDIETIKKLIGEQGLTTQSDDTSDMIKYLMLVPKENVKNGVSDIVSLYDDLGGGTFYGEAKSKQDYLEHKLICEQRTLDFSDTVNQITDQLIKEAHNFESPLEAIERLDYLSERACVKLAVLRPKFDAAVFGEKSAFYILEARQRLARGDKNGADWSLRSAQKLAVSGACPLFKSSDLNNENDSSNNNESSDGKKKMMKCPFCEAKVFDDPCASVLSCWDCKAMVVNGNVKYSGDGGSKKRSQKAVEVGPTKRGHESIEDSNNDSEGTSSTAITNVGQLAVAAV